MHSLKQGNFFTTKKNGYQYLEKKSNSKLIEGFIEANTNPNMNTNWKMFENHMVKHETAVGSEFKYDSSNTDVTHNIPGYNNMSVQEQEEKDNEILNAADASTAGNNIYAIEILKNGKVLYYQKVNSGFPNGKTPTIYSQASAAKLFLRKNNGMTESIPSSIVTNDAIMDSLSLDDGNFNTVMSWYNTILNEYDLKLKEYYEKKEAAAKEVDKGAAYKGKIISWQEDNTIKYAYINNMGVYRILDIPGLVGSSSGTVGGDTNPGGNLIKSSCPVNVTPAGEKPSDLGLQGGVTTYTKWEGACFNPGLYYDDNTNEFFVDHEGKVHKNPQGTGKCSEWGMNKIKVKEGTYENIENVSTTQGNNCEYTLGNSDADLVLLENRVKELNGELKTLAGNAEGENAGPTVLSEATRTLLGDKNMEKIDGSYTVTNGLLQILQQMPAKESDDMGYRKILHALKNETSVKIPMKQGGVPTTMDISGILATQNELNQKMKELSNLGNNVASLESSMISKQEQIRAINLHFIAWGLAGITIGAIGLHTFFKK